MVIKNTAHSGIIKNTAQKELYIFFTHDHGTSTKLTITLRHKKNSMYFK